MRSELTKKLCIASALSGVAFICLAITFGKYANDDDNVPVPVPVPVPDAIPQPQPQPTPAPDFATAADECATAMIERRMLPMIANKTINFHTMNDIGIPLSTEDFLQRVDDVAAYQLSVCEQETNTEITSASDEHLQMLEDAKQQFRMEFPNQ